MKSLRYRSNICSNALRNYKLYTCNPNRYVSTVVGDTEEVDANLADEKKFVDSCFPWRSSPASVRMSFTELITNHVCGALIHDVHFNRDSQIAPRLDKKRKAMLFIWSLFDLQVDYNRYKLYILNMTEFLVFTLIIIFSLYSRLSFNKRLLLS